MGEYLMMSIAGIVICTIIDIGLKTNLYRRERFWVFMGTVAILTIIVDNIFGMVPTETLNQKILSGITLGKAPVENVIFGIDMMWLNIIVFEKLKNNK